MIHTKLPRKPDEKGANEDCNSSAGLCLNQLEQFYAATGTGSQNSVWLLSPANTWNKLSIVVISLFTRDWINRAKLVRSNRHRQRFVISKDLQGKNKPINKKSSPFSVCFSISLCLDVNKLSESYSKEKVTGKNNFQHAMLDRRRNL